MTSNPVVIPPESPSGTRLEDDIAIEFATATYILTDIDELGSLF